MHNVEATWEGFGAPQLVPDFYRSLEEIVNPLIRAGFRLQELHETRPHPALREKDPYRFELYNRFPTFLCIEARNE